MSSNRMSIERRAANVQRYIQTNSTPMPRSGIVQFTAHQHDRKILSEGGTIILFVLEQ